MVFPAILVLAGLAGPLAPPPSASPVTAEVALAQEARWAAALLARDADAFGALLADDLRHVGFEGEIAGKHEYMAFFRGGDWRYSEYVLVDPRVAIEGSVAVVTGRVRRKIVIAGRETAGEFAFTHVWARRGASLRVISSQVSAAPARTPPAPSPASK